eukprot:scaffold1854_cov113-Isochrysis_galbana.AAC.20
MGSRASPSLSLFPLPRGRASRANATGHSTIPWRFVGNKYYYRQRAKGKGRGNGNREQEQEDDAGIQGEQPPPHHRPTTPPTASPQEGASPAGQCVVRPIGLVRVSQYIQRRLLPRRHARQLAQRVAGVAPHELVPGQRGQQRGAARDGPCRGHVPEPETDPHGAQHDLEQHHERDLRGGHVARCDEHRDVEEGHGHRVGQREQEEARRPPHRGRACPKVVRVGGVVARQVQGKQCGAEGGERSGQGHVGGGAVQRRVPVHSQRCSLREARQQRQNVTHTRVVGPRAAAGRPRDSSEHRPVAAAPATHGIDQPRGEDQADRSDGEPEGDDRAPGQRLVQHQLAKQRGPEWRQRDEQQRLGGVRQQQAEREGELVAQLAQGRGKEVLRRCSRAVKAPVRA